MDMKIAIMQPYFLPYIGYFQLMAAVDEFVVYDNIQFTKRGWIHRNRILVNGEDRLVSLPIQRDSHTLDVRERRLAASFGKERQKLLRRIENAYRQAPYFTMSMPVVERCLRSDERNLFYFILQSLLEIRDHLGIRSRLTISSAVDADHSLKGKHRVIAICQSLSASHYINPVGGMRLYDKDEFRTHGLTLSFLQTNRQMRYPQFGEKFVPNLSILDVLMFNSVGQINDMLDDYELV